MLREVIEVHSKNRISWSNSFSEKVSLIIKSIRNLVLKDAKRKIIENSIPGRTKSIQNISKMHEGLKLHGARDEVF